MATSKACEVFKILLAVSIICISVIGIAALMIYILGDSGEHLESSMDLSVDPCTNFYGYTCGRWTGKKHPPEIISPGVTIWSNSYRNAETLEGQLTSMLTRGDSDTDTEAIRKARKVYRACVDKDKIDAAGLEPLKSFIKDNGGWPLIMKPGEWKSQNMTWQQIHSKLGSNFDLWGLFTLHIVNNKKIFPSPRIVIAPPDLFLEKHELLAPANNSVSTAYNLLKVQVRDALRGPSNGTSVDEDNAALTALNNFERQLAEINPNREEYVTISMDKWLATMTIDEFQKVYDSANTNSSTAKIDWLEMNRDPFRTLLPERLVNGSEPILVMGNNSFSKMAAILNNTSQETIVNYIMWKAITELSLSTNSELLEFFLEFNRQHVGAVLIGSREDECKKMMGKQRAVYYSLTKEYVSNKTKQEVIAMVENIQEGIIQHIRDSTSMDNGTKVLAYEKINTLVKHIAYPDDLYDVDIDEYYSEFTPTDSHFGNELKRRTFEMKKTLESLGELHSRDEWFYESTMAKAGYIPTINTIEIPWGLLQLFWSDFNRPSAEKYGTMGMIIGHEIAHALTGTGRIYDKDGNVAIWWPTATTSKYGEQEQCFIDQYNKYTIFKNATTTIHVNGTSTAGENIADTTGLELAWNAYNVVRKHRKSSEPFERFSDDQRFFIAFGNLWCTYQSDLYLLKHTVKDVHSPAEARVNGAVSNMEAFAEAFKCPEDSPMNPSKKCSIWG